MSDCEHKTSERVGINDDFAIFKCSYGCGEYFITTRGTSKVINIQDMLDELEQSRKVRIAHE